MRHLLITSIVILIRISCYAQSNTSIADSNNHFAFKLYSEVKSEKPEQNLFFSPFSISTALAMTYAGARNETEKQMSQTPFHENFGALINEIEKDTLGVTKLSIVNSLWAQKDYPFLDSFFNLVKAHYDAILKNVDFKNNAEREKVRKELNNWVEQKTKDKIKELVKEKDINEYTRLILVNAIYFKSEWDHTFKKSETKEKPFYFNDNDTIHTSMMHNDEASVKYYENEKMQVVEIPYKNQSLSMVIFLPKKIDGIDDLENSMNNENYLNTIKSLSPKTINLYIPKFTTKFDFRLDAALKIMGMPFAFDPYKADFSGMSGRKDLYIYHVLHQAYINVNESGTEAAAATAVIIAHYSVMLNNNLIIFNADHPFIYLIKDNNTGSILFMGKIMNPKAN
ncbi:MAG: serpin family protein [Bacteroidales bacterium]